MEDLLVKLQTASTQQLQDLLTIEDNDRTKTQKRIQALKEVLEELEIVAAAATPLDIANDSQQPINHNPSILTGEFYATYLAVLLLGKNLNDARFLWKRIDQTTKTQSKPLQNVWEIGKGLWKRDYAIAYQAMRVVWPTSLQPLIQLLQQNTRDATTELLSQVYTTISCADAMIALGFEDQTLFAQYVQELGWTMTEQWLHPKALSYTRSQESSLNQLETISNYVLHLEETTLLNLS